MVVAIKRWLFASLSGISALIISVSLSSYRATDLSLLYDTTTLPDTANWLGSFGASLAGLLLYLFGTSAYVLSIFFINICMRYAVPQVLHKDKVQLTMILIVLPISSLIAHVYKFELFSGIYPGGYIGGILFSVLSYCLDETLHDLFLYVLLWAMLVLVLRFSSISFFIQLGGKISLLLQRARTLKERAVYVLQWIKSKMSLSVEKEVIQEETTIYSDPFWSGYIKPAYQVEEKASVQELEKSAEKETCSEQTGYQLPRCEAPAKTSAIDVAFEVENKERARALEQKLERFGIQGTVTAITQGPVVTLFEYQPSPDTKISHIIAREDDLALALQALSLRIIAPIPGRSVIGFEVAHTKRVPVLFSELLQSHEFVHSKGVLPLILGKDTLGAHSIIDLASMPHMLVAGSTGSGKSVGLNAMLMSLLCSRTPAEVRCILIDPKRLEFSLYADIAHLIFPIITDPSRALIALRWAVKTMEDRYTMMAEKGVRNIHEYNTHAQKVHEEVLPFIVIIIDELADLMMTAGKDVEHLIARLAQMSRAAGIHLILATQRPSVDVITGLIKVNFPSRIAFKVTSKVDSRTILDTTGAEKLLGKGDMLFLDAKGAVTRIHGAYVTDSEINAVVEHIKVQQQVSYESLSVTKPESTRAEVDDVLYNEVLDFLHQKDEVSISLIQRAFRVGYNRSARLIDQLESQGYIMPADGSKMRKVIKDSVKAHDCSNKI